jgi:hypothetical protein
VAVQQVKWFSQSQPQTLQMAVMLLYSLSALAVIEALVYGAGGLFFLILVVGQVAGALGISNDSKAGYRVALTFAFLPFAFYIYYFVRYHVIGVSILALAFQVALVCLLLHHNSREYTRIWFS